MSKQLIEYLDEKFQRFERTVDRGLVSVTWRLHSYDYAGMDYGFDLVYFKGKWKLKTNPDSGYGTFKVLLEWEDPVPNEPLNNILECFAPTNPNYKTQRK